MCGIIGYNGEASATKQIITGLRKIEYRGYDSSGLAVLKSKGHVGIVKTKGGIDDLEKKVDLTNRGHLGIGHTRWATHGKPSEKNAHPHQSSNFTLVHNGIIENYEEIQTLIESDGYKDIKSETDTEILAWLIERNFKQSGNIRSALVESLKMVRGTFGLAIIHNNTPNVLYIARRSSPIIIAQLDNGYLAASDVTALPKNTEHVTYLEDDQFAVITPDSLRVYNLDHDIVNHQKEKFKSSVLEVTKEGNDHYMLKEILEQPQSVAETIRGRIDDKNQTSMLGGMNLEPTEAKKLNQIIAVACGTAHYSSKLASYLYEDIVDIPLDVEYASEFLYRKRQYTPGETMGLAVSQSGETADTMAAVNKLNLLGVYTYGVVNAVGSNISRITDSGSYLRCGPEIAVASTKAFTSQVVAQLLLGIKLNQLRGNEGKNNSLALKAIKKLPSDLEEAIEATQADCKKLAKDAQHYSKVIFLGRDSLYPVALEGALKFKEITYTPAEAHAAGEMKHGPLALVDKDMLVVYLIKEGKLFDKSLSNLKEIDARDGRVIIVTDSQKLASTRDDVIQIPKIDELTAPLTFNIPLQLLAYYTALAKGLNIDKPRNLAKSVTVE